MILINKTKEYIEEISAICAGLIALCIMIMRDIFEVLCYITRKIIQLSLPGNAEYSL